MTKMALILVLLAGGMTPAGAATPAPENFGQYLVEHEGELAPFFTKNKTELVRQSVPLVLEWMGKVLVVAFTIGAAIDVFLGRGFATLFSPTQARFRPALIYAGGRAVLNFVLLGIFSAAVVSLAGSEHLRFTLLILAIGFIIVGAALQVGWIHLIFKSELPIAVLFYLTLLVVHGFLTLAVSSSLGSKPASGSETAFMDQTVTPRLLSEVKVERKNLAAATAERDEAAQKAGRLQDRLDQARAEEEDVQKQIDAAKTSESYLYVQAVKLHAAGKLAEARAQFAGLLERFPGGPMTGLVRGQVVQIDSESAATEAAKKEAQAAAAQREQQAQANFAARIAHGQVTLTEMRHALIGKSRPEVTALLGQPSAVGPDRWGFNRQMIVDPLTSRRSGLTVYFSEGRVLSLDYYSGGMEGQ